MIEALALGVFLQAVAPLVATPTAALPAAPSAMAGPRLVTATARFKLFAEPVKLHWACAADGRGATGGEVRVDGLADLDGDGRLDAYGVGDGDNPFPNGPRVEGGAIVARLCGPRGFTDGRTVQIDAGHALYAVGKVDAGPGEAVVVADEAGVRAYSLARARPSPRAGEGNAAWPLPDLDAPAPVTIATAGLDYGPERTEAAEILLDLDRDGRLDLLLPRRGRYELRRQLAPGRFEEPRPIPIEFERGARVGGARPGAALEAEFAVPRLELADLNGDGRDDVIVREEGRNRYYLQAADGSLPAEPSFTLALADFRDPEAAPRPEGILDMLDDLRFTKDAIEEADLDGDGIRDYVVLTSSRVLAFRGTRAGVNTADPWQILRFGAAVGNLFLFDVNGDGRKDLVALRVDLPPIPRMLVGFFAGFTVDLRVMAFLAGPDGRFSRKPDKANTIHVEIPPIVEVLRDPKKFEKKLEPVKKLRWRADEVAEVDLEGTGRPLEVVFGDGLARIWRPREGAPGAKPAPAAGGVRVGRRVRIDAGGIAAIADQFVFNPDRATYSIDTLPGALEELSHLIRTSGEARRAAAEAGELVATAALGEDPTSVEARDVDGDGRVDLVIRSGSGMTILWNRAP